MREKEMKAKNALEIRANAKLSLTRIEKIMYKLPIEDVE